MALPTPLAEVIESVDYPATSVSLQRFIQEAVQRAAVNGGVIGLSGGLDSSVAAFLAVRALGNQRVLGLLLPDSRVTPQPDIDDARAVAVRLGIEKRELDLRPIHEQFMEIVAPDRLAEGNLRARIRMCLLYYHANLLHRLVIGTGDRSEALLGYFTKHGDGGADVLPLGSLYKSQVRELGRLVGVPVTILEKKSSPRLWAGHEAEDELGLPYETLDPILHALFDRRLSAVDSARAVGVDEAIVQRVLAMHAGSAHKRQLPPFPSLASA